MVVGSAELLHLLGGYVNTSLLVSLSHGKVDVESGQLGLGILGGDDLRMRKWRKWEARKARSATGLVQTASRVRQLTFIVLEKSRMWSYKVNSPLKKGVTAPRVSAILDETERELDEANVRGNEVNTSSLDRLPAGKTGLLGHSLELLSGDFTSPVRLEGFLHFTERANFFGLSR